MNQRIQGLIAGVIIGVTFTGSLAFAQDITKNIEIIYDNIKIFIDGSEYIAKDANGNTVEPFIYNGTTYLPVRGIANAFNKDVVWDGENSSIYLGKSDQNQPDNWLDKIQYSAYIEGDNAHNLYRISGNLTDFLNTDYTNGMLFTGYDYNLGEIQDDKDKACFIIDYPLNNQYNKLSGKVVLPKNAKIAGYERENLNNEGQTCDIFFYSDGKLIKTLTQVSPTMPFNFDISVKGTNTLTIKIKMNSRGAVTALTDLALYK